MTFSPIISAAGTVPDSAAAANPAGAAADPATAVREPATIAEPGTDSDQPIEPPAQPSSTDVGTGTGAGDSPIGQGGYSTDQPGSATDDAGYSTDDANYSADDAGYSASDAGSAADSAAGSGQQDEAGAAWPHQSFLELGALPTAAPCARLHTTLVLWEWQLDTLVNPAGLVVSELVSNAVQASAGLTGSRFAGQWTPGVPPVRMWLSADDHRVVIQIWDGSDRPPVPQPVEPEAASGRGLLLVGALSAEWGCYTPEKSSGKVVWAVVTS